MVDVTASSIELVGEPRMIFEKKHNRNNPTYHKVVEVDRGMSWEQAVSKKPQCQLATYVRTCTNVSYFARVPVLGYQLYMYNSCTTYVCK